MCRYAGANHYLDPFPDLSITLTLSLTYRYPLP